MASISYFGFIKVFWKLNHNIAMDNVQNIFNLHQSVDLPVTSSNLLVTLSFGENRFLTHLAALLWVISIFFMLCFVWGTRLGRHTRLQGQQLLL